MSASPFAFVHAPVTPARIFPIQLEKMCFTSEREDDVLAIDGVGVVSCRDVRDFERCVVD